MKSASVATSGQLPEHSARKPELRFDNKVQKVVGHQPVVTGSRVHFDIRQRRALRLYRVPSLTYASEDEYHLRLQVVLPNAWLQRRGAKPRKLRRRRYHEKDAIAASAASHCSGCARCRRSAEHYHAAFSSNEPRTHRLTYILLKIQ
jgi:hypothetical protein